MSRDESGHVIVLAVGLMLVCFAIAGLALDGTRAFLAQRALQNAADAAAIAAAAELDRSMYYRSGGVDIRLNPSQAEHSIARSLRHRGLDASAQMQINQRRVEVALRSRIETGFLGLIGVDSIAIGAVANAEPFAQMPLPR